MARVEVELRNMKEDIEDLKDEVSGLRRALWATAGSMLIFALTLATTINLTGLVR